MPKSMNRKDIDEAIRQYATAVGYIVYEWNLLHERLGQIFALIHPEGKDVALADWYSKYDDTVLRKKLRKAVSNSDFSETIYKDKLQQELLWILKECCVLADDRNRAIHAPAIAHIDFRRDVITDVKPFDVFGHPRAKEFKGKDLLKELESYSQTARILGEYSEAVQGAIQFPMTNGLPMRPKLSAHGPEDCQSS